MQISSNLHSNVSRSTRINSSSVHTYIFVCFTLRVILQGFVTQNATPSILPPHPFPPPLLRHLAKSYHLYSSASPCALISYLECFHVCFSCTISLIKTKINYCYWQFGWILFHSRNIHINALAEAEPDISGILWFSLSQNMKCLYYMNETISSQIASSKS